MKMVLNRTDSSLKKDWKSYGAILKRKIGDITVLLKGSDGSRQNLLKKLFPWNGGVTRGNRIKLKRCLKNIEIVFYMNALKCGIHSLDNVINQSRNFNGFKAKFD